MSLRLPSLRLSLCALACASGCLGPLLELPEQRGGAASEGQPAATQPARSFLVSRPSELIDGDTADGRVGDLRLENERVAVIISAATHPVGFALTGGNIIDAAPLGSRDALKQLYGYLGDSFPRQPRYQRVETGMRGPVAVVVARGVDSDDPDIAIETDYALAPGVNELQIRSRYTNRGDHARDKYLVGDAIEWGRCERFAPESGQAPSGHVAIDAGWMQGSGDDVAYAYVVARGALDGRHSWAWSDFTIKTLTLAPGESAAVTRHLVIGAPGDGRVSQAVAKLRHERWTRIGGRILEEGTAQPLAGVRVFFDDRDGVPLGVTRSTSAGYQAFLPPGEYLVRAEGIGRRGPDRLDVRLGEGTAATHDLFMSQKGALAFTVRADGKPTPAKLTLLGLDNTRDPDFGPPFTTPARNVVLSADGRGRVDVAPGRYRVLASRGPAYTLDEARLEVKAGQTAEARLELRRAIDDFGLRCFDPHQHTGRSSDSAVSLGDRALSGLAEGLDFLVATDHDAVAGDWDQALAQLGAARPLEVVPGDEASVGDGAHFSVYPWEHQPGAARGGAPDLGGKSAGEALRLLGGAERVVQLDHPRAGGHIGYFESLGESLGLDARAPLPAGLAINFDALEIFSGKDTAKVEPPLRDWLALLDRGLTFTAVGGSDSHLIVGQEVGYPRTCIPLPEGTPAEEGLVNALKRRREALVTNGPFVNVSVAGHGMGQLAPAPRGHAHVEIEVQAAPWIDTAKIELFVNGTRRGKPIEIPPGRQALRFRNSVELHVERDAYLVVVVRGEAPLGPVVPPDEAQQAVTPLAITNPIYLDRDGDGRYTPPAVTLKAAPPPKSP